MTLNWTNCQQDTSVLQPFPVNIRLEKSGCRYKRHQLSGMNYSCKIVLWHRPLMDDEEVDEVSARYKCVPSFTCKYQSRMQVTGTEIVTSIAF
jgi:hypothetical protein